MQKCLFCLAGQADALFVDEEGSITILDWKRTKTIRFENGFQSLKEPLENLPHSNGWLYCLQLNVYKWMVESEFGLRVSGMYLGQVHPCLERAVLIEVPPMREELELIVEDQIRRGEALSHALPGDDAPFTLPPMENIGSLSRRKCLREYSHAPCVRVFMVHVRANARF